MPPTTARLHLQADPGLVRRAFATLLLALLTLYPAHHLPARQTLPTQGEIGRLREELQARQRERETEQSQSTLVVWEQLASAPDMRLTADGAAVHLSNQMLNLRAIWLFEPEPGTTAQPLRVLACQRGEEWITLAPGDWRVRLIAGWPGGGKALHLPAQTVSARSGRVYELALTTDIEQELKAQLRAARPKHAAPDQESSGQEPPPPAAQPAQSGRPAGKIGRHTLPMPHTNRWPGRKSSF